MIRERLAGTSCPAPFPIYERLADDLVAAHGSEASSRDETIAHVLAIAAGYSYSDIETVSTMMARAGLDGHACVRVALRVDAMYIFSTAYLIQSKCGRVVILSYRGTEPANLGNFVTDADVGAASIRCGNERLRVHAGFYRNFRATRLPVFEELQKAASGKSLLDGHALEAPMQALYVTGHSLGGAMAVLCGLSIATDPAEHELLARLRAIYTYGQPLTVGDELPRSMASVAARVFRHVNSRDVVPTLPAAAWGRFSHFGNEYRRVDGAWVRAEEPVAQLKNMREVPRSFLAVLESTSRKKLSRYTIAEHPPHEYIAALRPADRVSEFGDDG